MCTSLLCLTTKKSEPSSRSLHIRLDFVPTGSLDCPDDRRSAIRMGDDFNLCRCKLLHRRCVLNVRCVCYGCKDVFIKARWCIYRECCFVISYRHLETNCFLSSSQCSSIGFITVPSESTGHHQWLHLPHLSWSPSLSSFTSMVTRLERLRRRLALRCPCRSFIIFLSGLARPLN